MFFAMQSPIAGFGNIIVQIGFILAAIAQAWRVDKTAALCLVPLAAWVAFASVLNFAIWFLYSGAGAEGIGFLAFTRATLWTVQICWVIS